MHLCSFVSVYLSVCLSSFRLASPSICLRICLPIYLPIYLFISQSINQSIYLPTYLLIHPSLCRSIYASYPSNYLPVCLSVYLSLFLSPLRLFTCSRAPSHASYCTEPSLRSLTLRKYRDALAKHGCISPEPTDTYPEASCSWAHGT